MIPSNYFEILVELKSIIMNKIVAACFLFFLSSVWLQAQDNGDPNKGEELFKKNCTACHSLDKKLVGPALKGVVSQLQSKGIDREWMHKWISNNAKLRASGDKYANQIFEEYKQSEMNVFEGILSDSDIDDILAYTENPPQPAPKEDISSQNQKLSDDAGQLNSTYFLISLGCIVLILALILIRVRELVRLQSNYELLNDLNKNRISSLADFYRKYRFSSYIVLIFLAFIALYGFWAWLMGIGVDKGYKPEQPIYFSHKIHVGINKIDCQLCHSGAKYGKVSEIPALSVCMNCHRNISEYKGDYLEPEKTRDFYNAEIQKIYEHVGWDAQEQEYSKKQKPIKWVRIHNMQDFVYFNHSQHVVVAEKTILSSHNKKNPNDPIDVVCKACHGKIDTMNVVQMANDFTMGWCVECHRTTQVDMNNNYNAEYYNKLHEKLKKQKPSDAVTVDAIGGLECGKCHY